MIPYIIIIVLNFNSIFSYISIPFTTIKENITPSFYVSTFMTSSFYSKVETKIKIGTPSQELSLRIKTLSIQLSINSIQMGTYKITRFNESNSSTFINLEPNSYSHNYGQPDFTFAMKSKDVINLENKLSLDNFTFLLGIEDYNINRESGVFGLRIADLDHRVNDVSFIKQLKERNLIKNYTFFIQYEKDEFNQTNSGKIIIGTFPHEYDPKKYNQKYFREFYAEIVGSSMGFKIKKAFYGDIFINEDFKAQLAIEDYFIRGTEKFKKILLEKFFQKNIDSGLCSFSSFDYMQDKQLGFFYCKTDLNLSEFKNIIFTVDNFGMSDEDKENFDLNNTHLIIELNYKDLFAEFDNKYYFLMYFPKRNYETDYFKFGKIIFQKYILNYNLETKKFGFYINEEKEDKNNNNKEKPNDENKNSDKKEENFVSWILVGILGFAVLVLIGYLIYINPCKKRSKRANELMDDNYTYEEGINQN